VRDDGLLVSVRLTPKGGRDGIGPAIALSDGTPVLQARVRAPAREGEANAALRALLAKAVGVPQSRVEIAAGATARIKSVLIEGEPAALAAALEHCLTQHEAQESR
jgi:uncharacterized protein (TIGR00251 family)